MVVLHSGDLARSFWSVALLCTVLVLSFLPTLPSSLSPSSFRAVASATPVPGDTSHPTKDAKPLLPSTCSSTTARGNVLLQQLQNALGDSDTDSDEEGPMIDEEQENEDDEEQENEDDEMEDEDSIDISKHGETIHAPTESSEFPTRQALRSTDSQINYADAADEDDMASKTLYRPMETKSTRLSRDSSRRGRKVTSAGASHRRFVCPICSKDFVRRDHLNRHQAEHGPKKMICSACQFPAHRFDNIRQHIRTVHKKEDIAKIIEESYKMNNAQTRDDYLNALKSKKKPSKTS